MRTKSEGPPRLTMELASCVAMISRRSRCCGEEGGGNGGRGGAGLIADAHQERGTGAIDHGIGELRGDDLAPQPVLRESIGKLVRDRLGKIAVELAAEIGIVRHA